MKTIRKLRLMLVVTLLGWASMAQAVNVYWDQENGSNSNSGLSASKPLKTWTAARNLWAEKNPDGGGWVYMMSPRTITDTDGTFNGSTSSGNMRIRRYTTLTGAMFICPDGTHLRFSNMLIDGRSTFNSGYDANSGFADEGPAGCMIEAFGQVTITNCTLQRGNGRCIYAHNDGTTKRNFVLTDVVIRGFIEGAGSAIFFRSGDWHNATLTRVEIYGCRAVDDSYGGTIRENGGTKTNLTVIDCNIHNNTAKCGAGIYWNAGGHTGAKLVVKGTTTIHHNTATLNGGGIYCEARMDVQEDVKIYNNTAQYGGGIYFRSYFGGDAGYDGQGFNVKVTDNVKVYSNSATRYGGGMCLRILNSPDVGFNASNTAITTTYSLTVDSDGAIYQNHAPQGGGVAILDLASKFFRGREADGSGLSKEIKRNVSIAGGTIHDNYTENAALSTQKGAGVFIRKYEGANNDDATDGEANPIPTGGYPALGGAGTITVTASGGTIYNNVTNNGHGGGVHIVNEFFGTSITSTCKVEVKDAAQIYKNTCYGNGGGVYIKGGDFVMNGGVIGKSGYPNLASSGNGGGLAVVDGNITINNGNIDYNQATYGTNPSGNNAGGYGGAFYLTGGTATVQGGSVSRNTADKNGGGFYVNATGSSTTTIKGGANVSYNTAVNGAGAFVNQGTLTIQDAATSINHNTASSKGAGIYMSSGTVSIANAQILNNTATNDGGGLFAGGGNVTVTGAAHINNNQARDGGGGYVNNGTLTLTGSGNGLQVNNNIATYSSTSYGNGGGFFVGGGNVSISGVCQVDGNSASDDGGGFYTTGGTVTISGANSVISNNTAVYWGGGVRAGGNVTLNNGQIFGNTANARGGGVYVQGGNFTMSNGTIGGNTAAYANKTLNSGSQGGGVFVSVGTATLTGGSICGNTTNAGYGGGVYMLGGTCTLSGGATIGGTTAAYGNSAKEGGGIYSNGGTITVKGGKLQYNTATSAGGAIYTNDADGVVNVEKEGTKATLSYIEYNSAQYGGGIYANRGTVNFSDGYIQYNHASEAGGGMYVNASDTDEDDYGKLYLRGSANLRRNYVPDGHDGGGVYLKGMVQVGEVLSNPDLLGTIRVQENYAGDSYEYYAPDGDTINNLTINTRNNIYLPDPVAVPSSSTSPHKGVITLVEDGINIEKTRVGFSVPHGNIPVIYCDYSSTSRDYLHQFSTGRANQYAVFDDTRHYIAVQYSNQPDIFDPDHVYLYGFWSNVVTGSTGDEYCYVNPATFDPMNIGTPCELAFFISYVNGLNNQTAHPNANGRLVADIDMSEFGWVPIGHLTQGYKGHFDGNGHTVSGIVSLLNTEYVDYGFFGNLNGGTVENLFIRDARFSIEMRDDNSKVYIGGIAGHSNNGTIENCEVQSIMYAEDSRTIMGGVIGLMATGTVHSVCAMPTMTGNLMGGLVGKLNKGNLQNSFANGKFNIEGTDYYSGGLVGQCSSGSLVENCYARLLGVTGPTDKFGVFVGDNNGGTVRYCYAPAGYTNYTISGNDPTGHGNYAVSELPYLYGHRDTQVTLASGESNMYLPTEDGDDKQMLIALNSWVDTINAKQSAIQYTEWGRPWQESDELKFINDDYPSLKMPVVNAVGGKQNDAYLYYGDVDNLLTNLTGANQSIWLYRTPTDTVRGDNSSSDAKLYIDEEVALINENALKAYVGITLDNSAGTAGANPTYFQDVTDATDWHMISTPLSNAPIGIDYSDNAQHEFSYGHPDDMPYYRFYPKNNAKHGYFPSHRYGESYPSSDATLTGYAGNYYTEWDFYSYYEPEYHWINFKRNSASHWHYDGWNLHITYPNEAKLVSGKGYFAATREETFLQCQGNLNNTDLTYDLTKTDGVPRHGYNLLGNPYQAYLDFDKFAEANAGGNGAIWASPSVASYTILDEDNPQVFAGHDHQDSLVFYRTYAYGSSDNEGVNPGRFIHQHQGFFVLLEDNTTATAKFNLDQRNASDTVSSSFRGEEHLNYPLVNLFATEANGNTDVVTVELGRPEAGGAPVMAGMRMGNAKIWCHYEDADYTIAFTQPGLTEANIRFETVEDTEYTMRWNTRNGDFTYLHLIDNLTGADVNCLTTDEYRFSARTSDYKSRFRLVFGYTGMEENVEGDSQQGNFAFMMGDELVVTGEGSLQVFDVSGRLLVSRELSDVQTTIQLPQVANGVYMLRLTDGKQTRVQKMVISK